MQPRIQGNSRSRQQGQVQRVDIEDHTVDGLRADGSRFQTQPFLRNSATASGGLPSARPSV